MLLQDNTQEIGKKKVWFFFLDADVLETANLSYNLAKAMPTAVDAKLE